MKNITCVFLLLNFCIKAQIITTIAGSVPYLGDHGDGGPAILAQIEPIGAITVDDFGNIYFFDGDGGGLRKIDTNGIITRFAGGYTYFKDSVPAISSWMGVNQMIFDKKGDMIISDGGTQRIRKIDQNGIITTIAGTDTVAGYSGDGGPATHAKLNQPVGIAYDSKGNLYIADAVNSVIRKVDTNGIITTYAGVGAPGNTGDGGPALLAQIAAPFLAIDSLDNLYLEDIGGGVIRKIDTNGIINRYLGRSPTYDNPDTTCVDSTGMWDPMGICFDRKGHLCYSEHMMGTIRLIKNDTVYTIAGTHRIGPGYSGDGGPAVDALVWGGQVCFDKKGNLYTADGMNHRIRKITYDGSTPVGIKEQAGENNALRIWPNPASNTLNVDGKEVIASEIYDANGRLVIKANEKSIDISCLPKGLYLIALKTGTQVIAKKFTKE